MSLEAVSSLLAQVPAQGASQLSRHGEQCLCQLPDRVIIQLNGNVAMEAMQISEAEALTVMISIKIPY